jgi:ADP-ribose pyrophosphatase
MSAIPVTVESKEIYKGRVFDVVVDTIREGDVEYKREIVKHRGSAVILPVFSDGTVALVEQYRHAAGRRLLEIPAGTLEPGEDPLTAAGRELEEEIGVRAEKIERLAAFYISPGFLTEKMHLFLATGLTATAQRLEDDEILSVRRTTLEEALEMIESGEIQDAKTITGLLLYNQRRGENAAATGSLPLNTPSE